MKKRTYKSTEFQAVNWDWLNSVVSGQRIVLGHDAAKTEQYSAVMQEDRTVLVTIRWKMPDQLEALVERLCSLDVSSLEVALEPSGTYGDPFRHRLETCGICVYRVNPKRTHDAAEVYDGVPSLHDAKSAMLVGRLHLEGISERWMEEDFSKRDVKAWLRVLNRHVEREDGNLNRLEGLLARHWPEALTVMDPDRVSLWWMLKEVGGPQQVAAQGQKARRLLRHKGGAQLQEDRIDALVKSAGRTVGVPMTEGEVSALQELASDTLAVHRARQAAERKVKRLARDFEPVRSLSPVVGVITAAVIVTEVGDPRHFTSAHAYEKGAGLNLKEKSSGRYVGQRKITKRGSGMARRYLYVAVMRWIQTDPVARRWKERKVRRDGGKWKNRAMVGLMRKLIQGLYHVGRGATFDSTKLFDLRRLGLAAS